jgi:hypothetical protein
MQVALNMVEYPTGSNKHYYRAKKKNTFTFSLDHFLNSAHGFFFITVTENYPKTVINTST